MRGNSLLQHCTRIPCVQPVKFAATLTATSAEKGWFLNVMETWGEKKDKSLAFSHKMFNHHQVGSVLCWLVCQQDYIKTTECISTKLGWSIIPLFLFP